MINLSHLFNYIYIFATLVFTVYGQLILKWRISSFGDMPSTYSSVFSYYLSLFSDPYILSGFFSAFLASLTWMAAMTKFELSYAYPFVSLNFVFILLLSYLFLNEPISASNIIGVFFIVLGTVIASKGLIS